MLCQHPKDKPVKGCRVCELRYKHRKTHNLPVTELTIPPIPVTTPLPLVGRKLDQPVCVYRGGVLSQSGCDYCALRHVKIDIRICDIHGRCIDEFDTRYKVRGVKKCQECYEYKSPPMIQSSTVSIPQVPLVGNTQEPPAITTVPDTVLITKHPEPTYTKTIAYGVTTVPERRSSTLPLTLRSLTNAGFHDPILFVDDRDDAGWGLMPEHTPDNIPLHLSLRKVFRTDGRIKAFGHWVLSLYELFIRNPHANLYALFQDDIIVSRNLRAYLDMVTLPHRGYMNLYTFPSNQKIAPDNGNTTGFYKSNQNGKSATALVFDAESIVPILTSPHVVKKLRSRNHSAWRSIDGGVIQCFRDANPVGQWHEYVHNPSLVQHIGDKSTIGNPDVHTTEDPNHWKATSFRGENFDCMTLLTKL